MISDSKRLPANILITASLMLSLPGQVFAAEVFDENTENIQEAADVGSSLRKAGFVPVPLPIADPTVGTGLGVVGLYMHPQREHDTVSPTTVSGLAGFYTDTDSWMVGGFHDHAWAQDRYRARGVLGYGEFNLQFFGIGEDSILANHPLDYGLDFLAFVPRFLVRAWDSKWFLGGEYFLLDTNTHFDFSQFLPPLPSIDVRSRIAALGFVADHDTRNEKFFPSKGHFFEGVLSRYDEAVGSDFEYNKTKLEYNSYHSLSDTFVLAWQMKANFSDGRVPFYDLPYLDLRGFPRGRFTDELAASTQVEGRWMFRQRWGAVVFLGTGKVAPSFDEFDNARFIPSYGFGGRYVVKPDQKLNIGLDFGFSDGESAYYIQIGEEF